MYERASRVSFANGCVTLTTAKPHELPAAGGRMRFYTPANQSLDPEVTVMDAHTLRFATTEAYADGLFVYGKYVDDFLSVMLNVSATQELARQVEALKKQNAALQAHVATAGSQATATTAAFEARLRRLEAAGEGQARK